jgi:hypothetical protein
MQPMPEPKCVHPALRAARDLFCGFYRTATAEDISRMDSLVLANVAFRHAVAVPREFVPDHYRLTFERACDGAEWKFLQARDCVRASETFKKLLPEYQERIASILFDAFPATD